MIRIPRWVVGLIGILFASFHAGLGIYNIPDTQDPTIAIVALAIYLLTVFPTVLFYKEERLPTFQALLNLAAAALIPLFVNAHLEPSAMSAYSTWYVLGVATLMAATAVRQQKIIAWIGTAILAIQVINWAGLGAGIQTGLLGALMLVFAGHAISSGLTKAYRDAMTFTNEALEIQKQQIANVVASEVRRSRLESALTSALPMLNLIKEQHGKLTHAQRAEARLLEAALRDEIRGRAFMHPIIRQSVAEARVRGVEVIILDEGGLDLVNQTERLSIFQKIADSIKQVQAGRITLRAPLDASWKVTLVATRPGVATPDIWLKF